MEQCVEHVDHQLPYQKTRVDYLMNGIKCGDPELQAAMALVKNDDADDGKMHNFEKAASFIIPANPVARRTTGDKKRGQAEVSGVTANKDT
eukprot:11548286-Ditylum_brightwellii.AAC.1